MCLLPISGLNHLGWEACMEGCADSQKGWLIHARLGSCESQDLSLLWSTRSWNRNSGSMLMEHALHGLAVPLVGAPLLGLDVVVDPLVAGLSTNHKSGQQ